MKYLNNYLITQIEKNFHLIFKVHLKLSILYVHDEVLINYN